MEALPIFVIAAIAILGTLAWLATVIVSAFAVARMPAEDRRLVPTTLWVFFGAAVLTSVVWPIGILASLGALIAGVHGLLRGAPEAKPVARASIAVGGSYVALVLALVLGSLAMMPMLRSM